LRVILILREFWADLLKKLSEIASYFVFKGVLDWFGSITLWNRKLFWF